MDGAETEGDPGPGAPLVLILGGTTEARILAAILEERGVPAVTSLAGRTSEPADVRGPVRSGGFGGAAELAVWIARTGIRAVVDATHPFAERISWSAAEAATAAGVPLLALRRPGWSAAPGDDWRRVRSPAAAAAELPRLGRRALLTIGRQEVAVFAGVVGVRVVVRAIEPPDGPLPADHVVLLDRGPYTVDDEIELLARHRIDVVVSKDSGGSATRAKLDAARLRGVPVLLVDRPATPDVPVVRDPVAAADWAAARVRG